jgi:hypothetical protein
MLAIYAFDNLGSFKPPLLIEGTFSLSDMAF